jgi:hypothetical protein
MPSPHQRHDVTVALPPPGGVLLMVARRPSPS